MALSNRKRTQTLLEAGALVTVIAVPLFAIGWYFLGGNDATTSSDTPSTAPQPVSASVTAQPASPTQGVGTVTLDNPSSLPLTVKAAQIVPFSFTLKNTQNASGIFDYKVYVKWNNGEEDVIDRNSITLGAGANTDIAESLKFETADAKAQVYIELEPSGPSINFPLPR